MNSGSTGKRGCSSRTDEESDRNSPSLDFTLYGSPAPRCSHRSVSVKAKKPIQPPSTPKGHPKVRKPLQLPIEKILILNEKIENDKREKIKLQLSTKQIKLQDGDDNSSATGKKKWDLSRQSGNADFPDDSSVDLTIDLSSVTNSEHESDSTSEEIEGFLPQMPRDVRERCCSTSTSTDTPTKCVWHLAGGNDSKAALRSPESSETGYPCTPASSSVHIPESWDSSKKISPTFSNQERQSRQPSFAPKCCRSRSADLIYVYVNTVNNRNELTKYFRPCHVCNEACCICPDLVSESNRSFSIYSSGSRGGVAAKTNEKETSHSDIISPNKPMHGDEILTADKNVETDPEMTDIDGSLGTELRYFDNAASLIDKDQWTVQPLFESRCSEFSSFLAKRYESKRTTANFNIEPEVSFDSGTSTLRRDDANESDSSSGTRKQAEAKSTAAKSIPLSVMQLATAAQCARILANSLESVLEMVDSGGEECPEAQDLIKFRGEDLNQLCETLRSLRCHFSASEQEIPDIDLSVAGTAGRKSPERNWVGFEAEEVMHPKSDVGKSTSGRDEKLRKCQNLRFEDDFNEFFPKVQVRDACSPVSEPPFN